MHTEEYDMELYLPTLRNEVVLCVCVLCVCLIFRSLYKMPMILNRLNVITKCTNGLWMMPWLIDPVGVIRSEHWCGFFVFQ